MAELEDYMAFISYRHADNREPGRQWATWLHQRLETYEVPEELIGSRNERGDEIPARIFPVFRDEEELPADSDLSGPIYRALDRSRFLVVLCSPRAVESSYVADEIVYFKKLGRADRVLAVFLDGEPGTEDRPCFPEPMRYEVSAEGELLRDKPAEPIAADLRLADGTEGWTTPEAYRKVLEAAGESRARIAAKVKAYEDRSRLAVLKIIAGILGLPLGQLTKRDQAYQLVRAKRKAQVLRRWLAAVAVLFLVATGAMVRAVQQQRLAEESARAERLAKERSEKARTAADEVINVMIYDLRDELRENDLTPLLDRILGVANRYFQTFPQDEESVEVLVNKATVLSKKSYDLLQQKRLKKADEAAREAVEIYESVVNAGPEGKKYLYELSIAMERLGDVIAMSGDLQAALVIFHEQQKILVSTYEKTPSPRSRDSLAIVRERIGKIHRDLEGASGALPYYKDAYGLRVESYREEPTPARARGLAIVCQFLNRLYLDIGERETGRYYLDKFLEVMRLLYESQPTAANKYLLSIAHQDKGNWHLKEDDGEGALEAYGVAKRLAQELYDANDSAENLSQLSISFQKVGQAFESLGRWEEAGEQYRMNLETARTLDKRESTPDTLDSLAYAHQFIGNVEMEAGDSEAAEKSYREQLRLMEKVMEASGETAFTCREVAQAWGNLTSAYIQGENYEEAAKTAAEFVRFRRATIQKMPSENSSEASLLLADALGVAAFVEMSAQRSESAVDLFGEAADLMAAGLAKKEDPDRRYALMDARISRALCLANLGKNEQAVAEYRRGLVDLEILEKGSHSPPNAPAVREFVEKELEDLED